MQAFARHITKRGARASALLVSLVAPGCAPQTATTEAAPAAAVAQSGSPSRNLGQAGTLGTVAPAAVGAPVAATSRQSTAGAAGVPTAAVFTQRAANVAGVGAAPVQTQPSQSAGAPAMGASPMGTAPMPGNVDLTRCPAPPADAPMDAVAALNATNTARLQTGAGCMSLQPALNTSATNHCKYNATNARDTMCQAGGHNEVMSCMGFTGVDVGARVKAAGYMGRAGVTEVLTQGGTPEQAVMGWIGTLWHRIPMLDPWTTDMGWGSADGCRIIDFGAGANPSPKELVTVYPYDGQTNYPVAFNGLESPQPPAPPGGFPSSSMISVYAQNIAVTEHVLTKDGDQTPIEHIWIDKNSPEVMAGYRYYLNITSFLYAHKPFEPNTKYRVKIVGTHTGGPLNLEWTFTTGAASRNPWGP